VDHSDGFVRVHAATANEDVHEAQFAQQEQHAPHLQRRQRQQRREKVGQDVAAEHLR